MREGGDKSNYPINLIMKEVAECVIQQWLKSNSGFVPYSTNKDIPSSKVGEGLDEIHLNCEGKGESFGEV